MRSLPVMLSIVLGLATLSACDKKAEEKSDAKTEEKADAKTEEKADAKKTGDEVSANAVDSEEGCIHENKPAHAEGEGCDHGGTAAPTESTGHFGAAFAITEAQPLSTALASGVPTAAVKVSGTVESVCQAKGCWMVIKEGDVTARVLVKDHAFAIPLDGKGKAATVEGTIEAKELTEANVAHLKKDGDANLEGDGARQEFFLHATAVELAANS